MYLADCGFRAETDLAVIVAIIILFAGLSLCMWVYLDWSQMLDNGYYAKRRVCIYGSNPEPTAEIVCNTAGKPCSRMVTAYPAGRAPVRYVLIPGTIPPV